jgi:hypothetical protein
MQTPDYKSMFQCDEFRIAKYSGKMFLILGWRRNTSQDEERWVRVNSSFRDGQPVDFNYLREKVIASGHTEAELFKSAKEYKRISGMSMVEYLQELIGDRHGSKKLRNKKILKTGVRSAEASPL